MQTDYRSRIKIIVDELKVVKITSAAEPIKIV